MKKKVIEEGDNYEISIQGSRQMYSVTLPEMSPSGMKLLKDAKDAAIMTEIGLERLTQEQRRVRTMEVVLKLLSEKAEEMGFDLDPKNKHLFAEFITNDMIGYGILEHFLVDDQIEEVMVIGTGLPVYVFHRKYGTCETNAIFENVQEMTNILDRIAFSVGRRIDSASPLLDARLKDGSRVNATMSPPSLDGPTLTIRKFKKDPLTIVDLLRFNTLNSEVGAFLWLVVDGLGVKPGNILIAGGTGSGKTTTLNALSAFIKDQERVITIEDTAELQLPVRHIIRFESRPAGIEGRGAISMNELLKNTLRMRPDRLVLGEVRGKEARTLFVAMNTGHDGCMGTCHANSSKEVITRLTNEPMDVPKIMIPALDLIIMQNRVTHRKMGFIRRITEISEVFGLVEETVSMSRIFEYSPENDVLKSTGTPSILKQKLARHSGVSAEEINSETEKRQIVLEYLHRKNVHKIDEVRSWIEDYYLDPTGTLEKIEENYLVEER